jgi:hypothetical protein
MSGKELNGIYDGYTFMPFILGHSYATSFSHYHNFVPHAWNHWVPHYGLFANRYFGRVLKSQMQMTEKFSSFKKTHGPPHYSYDQRWDPLDKNEYLLKNSIPLSDVKMFEPKVRFVDHHDHH